MFLCISGLVVSGYTLLVLPVIIYFFNTSEEGDFKLQTSILEVGGYANQATGLWHIRGCYNNATKKPMYLLTLLLEDPEKSIGK